MSDGNSVAEISRKQKLGLQNQFREIRDAKLCKILTSEMHVFGLFLSDLLLKLNSDYLSNIQSHSWRPNS